MPMDDPAPPAPMRAVRLIFEYEGDQVRLVSQQPVEMVVTGFDLARAEQAGHFVEVRSAADRTLARVPARGAFGASAEVFPERHGDPIARVDVERPKGAFTTVVPAAAEADHVSVVRVAPGGPGAAGAAALATDAEVREPRVAELARFPLLKETP